MTKGGPQTRNPSGTSTKMLAAKVTEAEHAEYKRAAARANLSLSAWLRDRLSKAAEREKRQFFSRYKDRPAPSDTGSESNSKLRRRES